MKIIYITSTFLFWSTITLSQALFNNGAGIYINTGGKIHVGGSLINNTGSSLANNGTLEIAGNTENNGTLDLPTGSNLNYLGNSSSTISGASPLVANNISVNNAAGIILQTTLQVNSALNFTNGIIDASNHPVVLGSTASSTGAADNSHVKGTVFKQGTGNFAYPIGDGVSYQKIEIDLSSNSDGLGVSYQSGDAGNGVFTDNGNQSQALESYNKGEYWNISPIGTASGIVKLFWDGYNDEETAPVSSRRVAYKNASGEWENAGGTGSGTTETGNIVSEQFVSLLSGSYTYGAINEILPLKWLAFKVKAQGPGTILEWRVNEYDVNSYEIERTYDGLSFKRIGSVNSKGDGINLYSFTSYDHTTGKSYYRIKQTDKNGAFSYSNVLDVLLQGNRLVNVYPNPSLGNDIHISVHDVKPHVLNVSVTDIAGKVLHAETITHKEGVDNYKLVLHNQLQPGYYLVNVNGKDFKEVFKLLVKQE